MSCVSRGPQKLSVKVSNDIWVVVVHVVVVSTSLVLWSNQIKYLRRCRLKGRGSSDRGFCKFDVIESKCVVVVESKYGQFLIT